MELAASWAINQPPRHHGTVCRISGDAGAVELDTPDGPVLYRGFGPEGKAKEIAPKLPKVALPCDDARIQGMHRRQIPPHLRQRTSDHPDANDRRGIQEDGRSVEIRPATAKDAA